MARDDDDVRDKGDEYDIKRPKNGNYTADEKQWAMLSHLGVLVVGFIAPLIIWQMKKDESEFVTRHAKDSLNFHITWTIVALFTCGLGGIVSLIFAIIAGLTANRGEEYQYPMYIRFIS